MRDSGSQWDPRGSHHGRGPGKIKRIKPQNTPVHRYCTNLAQGDKSLEKEEIVPFLRKYLLPILVANFDQFNGTINYLQYQY
jgi:hypothetical protein